MDQAAIVAGYAAEAAALVPRFEALDSEEVLAPVIDLVPVNPGTALDIGAGTGRDAAWLARRGHAVLAAEPVAALRTAGQALHPELGWLDDSLPALANVRARGQRFDLIVCIAVWQHLPASEHPAAMTAIASLLAPGGRAILSIRHGPGSSTRPCFPADVEELVAVADREGLDLVARRAAESIQPRNRAAGVTWDWLVLDRRL